MPAMNRSKDPSSFQRTVILPTAGDRGAAISVLGATLEVTRDPVLTTAPAPMFRIFPEEQTTSAPGPTKTLGPIVTRPSPRVCAMITHRIASVVLSNNSTSSGYSFSR